MKILHTSDWHLGRALYGKKRYEEFASFLNWLVETIEANAIAALLVAGDVFDTGTPSNQAQALYYRFLGRVAASSCRHVIIVAGNHDSPSFLNAPKELLNALNVHVVVSGEPLAEQVLVLRDQQQLPELIVCAVPYLRDKDVRMVDVGESVEDKERKLLEGIRQHYALVAERAEQQRAELGEELPIVAMGHLFTAGGQTVEGDGVRELYVGSLAHITAGIFPPCFNYLALGHLHVPQKVNGLETARYSGSPLPMGFGEAKQQKSVCVVDFHGTKAAVQLIDVPVFRQLERISGDWAHISNRITQLLATGFQGWLDIVYQSDEVAANLSERLEAAIAGSQVEILRVKNERMVGRVLGKSHPEETLDDLTVTQVFERCLTAHNVDHAQRPALLHSYQEILLSIYQDDPQAQ